MIEQVVLILIATILSNVLTWTMATYRASSAQKELQRDFEMHQAALALTDKRLRMVLRISLDIAKKLNLEIRAADILEMADVLGGE